MSKGIFCIGFLMLFTVSAKAQNDYIVKLQTGVTPAQYQLQNGVRLTEISREMGLYQATPSENQSVRSFSRTQTSQHQYAIPNHPVTLRQNVAAPNDPLLEDLWNFKLTDTVVGINAPAAWQDFGTGGRDKSSQDVVIAIVDGGFDIGHPDLFVNRWINWREVPNNGRDDDGNGYIDDVNGWNAMAKNGKIQTADHGTHVAGIIGARGNNARGVVGVNWRTKMMYVSAGNGLGDTITTMRAYSYVLKQKQLWLQSGGKKGANVVAINSSFGIDARKCSDPDFTVWNDMIEQLGKVGILSIAATSNFEIDVDQHGDIPTSCESPYLIAVTNSTSSGSRSAGVPWNPTLSGPSFFNFGSGFGKTHIDIAAPGDEVLSTAQRTTAASGSTAYSAQSGTSFSTPHVAGAVGYLHSVASVGFNQRSRANPSAAALELKAALLATVTPVSDLQSEVASGGVLNLHAAAHMLQENAPLLTSN